MSFQDKYKSLSPAALALQLLERRSAIGDFHFDFRGISIVALLKFACDAVQIAVVCPNSFGRDNIETFLNGLV